MQIKLFKTKKLKTLPKDDLKLLKQFIEFASDYLEFDSTFTVTLMHAAPAIEITFGAYQPHDDHIYVIVEGRNFLDWARTLAHEMVHQRQKSQGRIKGEVQAIGGELEDEANAVAGQIMKSFNKTQLTPEQKKKLGLGGYGNSGSK